MVIVFYHGKFGVGDDVRLPEFSGTVNEFARVVGRKDADGKYWVTNLKAPFMGTISDFFSENQMEKVQ